MQGKRILGGGGGSESVQKTILADFGTTAVSPIPTLTIKKLFCLWHEK